MTKSGAEERCRWCGGRFAQLPGRGRPRQYCRPSCRQQAHVARRAAGAHRVAVDEVVVRREDLETIQSAVYGLQAALEDVRGDLADDDSPKGLRSALEHLVAEAEPMAALWITPVAAAE